jgi:hypothetical protein
VNCLVGEPAVGELGVGELSVGEQSTTHRYLIVSLTHDFKLQMRFSQNFEISFFDEIVLNNSKPTK